MKIEENNRINGTDDVKKMLPVSEVLKEKEWGEVCPGYYRSSGQNKVIKDFKLYIRRRKMSSFIESMTKRVLQVGKEGESLPEMSSFSKYESLRTIRSDERCLVIGYDSEWENIKIGKDVIGREMLSWQFALVSGESLVEFVFIKTSDRNICLEEAIACILDNLDGYTPIDIRSARKYVYCSKWKNGKPVEKKTRDINEAISKGRYIYQKGFGFTEELVGEKQSVDTYYPMVEFEPKTRIKINIVCHTGKVDLSGIDYRTKFLPKYLTEVQGGLVSFRHINYEIRSLKTVNNPKVYPIALSVSDTMCHTPVGKKKLKDLGKAIQIEKVEIPREQKEHMRELLDNDFSLYMEYASTDSVITLLYLSALYGYNCKPGTTVTAAAARVLKEKIKKYMESDTEEEFDRAYRGLKKVNHGKVKNVNKPGFVEATSLEPISDAASIVQELASKAYHGGYNICSEVGYFPYATFDYDLKNAYPTAMALVPDIDWDNPIRKEIKERELTLSDFIENGKENPIALFTGCVSFEFPEGCKYPSIPICEDGIPVYTRTSENEEVYAAGPYIWLALKLGAKVKCIRGYFLNAKYRKDLSEKSKSLATAVKQLVKDRKKAKADFGKDSLEELILKVMVNAAYGKIAQNVIEKQTWSAYENAMKSIGCSGVTNPVSAMMITSIVQVELIAVQNQIHEKGYMSCSVTTDGFISNCPINILRELDLYGLRECMEEARLYLTDGDDKDIWEIKHAQDDLLNFTTRGNASLYWAEKDEQTGEIKGNLFKYGYKEYPGVCARNSTKSGFNKDSYEDRKWLMESVLTRIDRIEYEDEEWFEFKEYVNHRKYYIKHVTRRVSMDFDMKRKPIKSSFSTDRVIIEGIEYEIAHFDTEPFENVEEFKLYRKVKNNTRTVRTEEDWKVFYKKLELNGCNVKSSDGEWSIMMSCIRGYRLGFWNIPFLSETKEIRSKDGTTKIIDAHSVEEKCSWINSHNTSERQFKISDWKNARKPERKSSMLPNEIIKEKLEELQNDVKTH